MAAFAGTGSGMRFLFLSPSSHWEQVLTCVMQSIAPLLIILRVAEGKAWSSKTEGMLTSTTINFATRDTDIENHKGPGSTTVLNTFNTPKGSAYSNSKGADEHSMVSDRIAVTPEINMEVSAKSAV